LRVVVTDMFRNVAAFMGVISRGGGDEMMADSEVGEGLTLKEALVEARDSFSDSSNNGGGMEGRLRWR
jgi:hypothetical protein